MCAPGMLPMLINSLIEVGVSKERVYRFLTKTELTPLPSPLDEAANNPYQSDRKQSGNKKSDRARLNTIAIEIVHGNFFWNDELTVPALEDVNLTVPKGSLTFVIGKTGSGKSALLNAVVGDLPVAVRDGSTALLNGSVAYTSQVTWIQNATLKGHSLFCIRL